MAKMDMYVAFFNQHVSDFNKAKKDYIKKYNEKKFNKNIMPHKRKGMMSIFKQNPTPDKIYFVKRVAYHVNRRVK